MPLTRAAVEAELVSRLGRRMAFVGMSIVTNGTNPDLNGPIRRALAFMGFPTATPLVVTDGDLAPLAPSPTATPARDAWRLERFCDVAALQLLQTILFATTDVDWQAGVDRVSANQFVKDLQTDMAKLEAKIMVPYGPDLPSALVGSMTPDPLRMPNDPFDPCRTRSRRGHGPYP